jgi:hypothetical protein
MNVIGMAAFGSQRIKPVSDCVFGNLDKIEVDTTNDRGIKLDSQLITLKKNTKLIELINKAQITLVDGTSYHLSPNIGNNEDVKQAYIRDGLQKQMWLKLWMWMETCNQV